jgi:TonB-linked SusC/RagA family outer membrane protein
MSIRSDIASTTRTIVCWLLVLGCLSHCDVSTASAVSQTVDGRPDNITISGTVIDENADPLPGVNIRLEGSGRGTSTDPDGTFSITIPDKGRQTLLFSFVGYKTVKRTVEESQSGVIIEMEIDQKELSEVMVTGYGVERTRTELVGSVTEVSGEELQPIRPEESFQSLLSGKVAGLIVNNPAGGNAGKPISVKIRGQGSLPTSGLRRSTSSQPLYILDGVPLYDIQSEQYNQAAGREELLNPLASLSADDIKSVSVLKDASAAAIYGANAANGVILIETKGGNTDGIDVDARVSHGVSRPINEVKLLNTEQYTRLYQETLMNDGLPAEQAAQRVGNEDVYTDWDERLMRRAAFTGANLSVSGGTDQVSARVSLSYSDKETISKGNDLQKYGLRSRIDYSFRDVFEVNLNTGITGIEKTSLGGFSNVPLPPNISPYEEDGSFNDNSIFQDRPNPLAVLEQNDNNHNSLATTNSLRLTVEPVDNLSLRALGGIDYYQNRNFIYRSKKNATGTDSGGGLTIVNRRNRKWITNLTGNYSFTLGESHAFSVLVGGEAQEKNTKVLRGSGTNFLNDELRVLQAAGSRTDRDAASSDDNVTTLSGFGELSYNYNGKFYTSLNARRDASSIFGGDVQNANFASLGVSYVLSKEALFENLSFLDLLKLKSSFGSTGNSRIGSYASKGLYSVSSQHSYAGRIGLVPSTPQNTRLTWEKNYKFNAGIDATLFDRLDVLVEYYRNDIVDAIASISIPHESGFTTGDVNAANMRNTGIEVTLGYSFFPEAALDWNLDVNAATNRNVVTKLKLDDPQISTVSGIGYKVGEDVRTIYGVKYAGVNPANGEALFELPDGTITEDYSVASKLENRQKIGNSNPDVFGGFTSTLSYNNFSLTLVGDYSFGSDILVSNLYATDGRQISFNNQSVDQLDRWQEPGDKTDVPRLSQDAEPYSVSDRYIYNLDYVKFASASLRYSLPSGLADRLSVKQASAFVTGTNIGYIYFGDAPNDQNGAAEYRYRFPEAQTITAGIDVTI